MFSVKLGSVFLGVVAIHIFMLCDHKANTTLLTTNVSASGDTA
jgi:hypothetical protein